MKELTYEEVVFQIENKRRFGNLTGVEITRHMLPILGQPQQGMQLIHIAGTNGKGSVSAFLCTILQAAGLKAGLFTSPHLEDFRERIRVNCEMIPKEDTVRLGNYLLSQNFEVCPTMFDYCLAMALLYFKEEHCDVVILETGLGGKMDSTNAVGMPEVSVITRIGYDHMAVLGNTLSEIAAEKAGIIKKGTSLVLGKQEQEAENVLLAAAKNAGTASCVCVKQQDIRDCRYTDGEQIFSFGGYKNIRMRLLGSYQYENAAAAILAAEAFFKKRGYKRIETQAYVRKGIYAAVWPGRMEILRREPFLLVDGAHNKDGVSALSDSLNMLFPGEKFRFVMGVMADKDYEEMAEMLIPLAVDFTTVTVESSRSLTAGQMAECIRNKGALAQEGRSTAAVIDAANCGREYKTVAFGSLYFIGEIKKLFH